MVALKTDTPSTRIECLNRHKVKGHTYQGIAGPSPVVEEAVKLPDAEPQMRLRAQSKFTATCTAQVKYVSPEAVPSWQCSVTSDSDVTRAYSRNLSRVTRLDESHAC